MKKKTIATKGNRKKIAGNKQKPNTSRQEKGVSNKTKRKITQELKERGNKSKQKKEPLEGS